MRAQRRSKIGKIAILVMVAAVILFVCLHGTRYLSFHYLQSQNDHLHAVSHRHPLLFIACFATAYIAATAVSLPGAALFTMASGALFGLLIGTVVALVSSVAGATLAFLVARYALREWVGQRFHARLLAIDRGLATDGAFYLVTLRLIAVIPFFIINLAMGVTAIRVVTFIAASAVGMIPGALVYANAGTRLGQLHSAKEVMSLPVILSFVALGVLPWIAKLAISLWRWRRTTGRTPAPREFTYDLAVIGAGAAGLTAASLGAQLGAKVLLVERSRMGGECLNTGCVPSKTLIRAAAIVAQARHPERFGLTAITVSSDFPTIMAHLRQVIATIAPHDASERFRALGVDCRQGHARITSPYHVEIAAERLSTRAIIIATGARPVLPHLPGIERVGAVTSETVWGLTALPRRLVVLGGGPVGCEFAQCFARLGSAVTIIQRDVQLLEREDLDVVQVLEAQLRAEGIRLQLGETVVRCETHDGVHTIVTLDADGMHEHVCDCVLVALGKHPDSADLGVEELGIHRDAQGRILTDEHQRTNFPNIFACGDVASLYQFTHVAGDQGLTAAANALVAPFSARRARTTSPPWITFTEPQVARVGLSQREASAQGIAIETTTHQYRDNDRALIEGDTTGMLTILTQQGSDVILGASLVVQAGAEGISEFAGAIEHGIGMRKLARVLKPYPSLGEATQKCAAQWQLRHTPGWQRRLVARYITLRRSAQATRRVLGIAVAVAVVLSGVVGWCLRHAPARTSMGASRSSSGASSASLPAAIASVPAATAGRTAR